MINSLVSDDVTREEIVDRYKKKIIKGSRTKLTRLERDQLAFLLLETLVHLSEAGEDSKDVIKSLCQEEIDLLEEGYSQTSIETSYLPTYTRLIQGAIASGQLKLTDLNSYEKPNSSHVNSDQDTEWTHYALDFLAYDNHSQSDFQATPEKPQEDTTGHLIDIDIYLEKVQELLSSGSAEEIAIALCALTGQRYTEFLGSERFEETEFPYLMRCKKNSNTTPSEINLLTLIPVRDILPHLQRWQHMLSNKSQETTHMTHKRAFANRVNQRIRKAFEFTQIVPVINGFKTVSVQRISEIYGAIAIHFFCPPPPQHNEFLRHYLSHCLELEQREDWSVEAAQHQFNYVPAQKGKITQEVGVKIPAHGLVPLLEKQPISESNISESNPVQQQANDPDSSKILELPLQSNEAIIPSHSQSSNTDELKSILSIQVKTIADQAQALQWLTAEVQTLREQVDQLQETHEKSVAQVQNLPVLQQECQRLQQENQTLRLAQKKVDAFKALLLDHGVEQSHINRDQPSNASSQAESSSQSKKQREKKLSSRSRQPSRDSLAAPQSSTSSKLDHSKELPKSPQSKTPDHYQLVPSKASKAQQRAASIVMAIQLWNHQHPDRSFAITKGLLEHEFGINRKAASEFLESNRQILFDYYKTIGVKNERGHNRQPGRDIQTLKNFVNEVFQQLN